MQKTKILALSTIYNRKDITIRCLSLLVDQIPDGFDVEIVVVDDGSTDGSGDAILESFPFVRLLKGGGNMYWAGGMRFGWENYAKHQHFDYLMVFNDDIQLLQNGLRSMLEDAAFLQSEGVDDFVLVGSCLKSNGVDVSYGGMIQRSAWFPARFHLVQPIGRLFEVHSLNMNIALITGACVKRLGFLAPYFVHGGADIEFGMRARRSGARIFVSRRSVAVCDHNDVRGTSLEPGVPPKERWRRMHSVKEQPFMQRIRFLSENGGLFWPLQIMFVYGKVFAYSFVYLLRPRHWFERKQ